MGLHDAHLEGIVLDWLGARLELNLRLMMSEREDTDQRACVTVTGLVYCAIDPPAIDPPTYVAIPEHGLWIDSGSGVGGEASRFPATPEGCFQQWIFVDDWNRYINICGERREPLVARAEPGAGARAHARPRCWRRRPGSGRLTTAREPPVPALTSCELDHVDDAAVLDVDDETSQPRGLDGESLRGSNVSRRVPGTSNQRRGNDDGRPLHRGGAVDDDHERVEQSEDGRRERTQRLGLTKTYARCFQEADRQKMEQRHVEGSLQSAFDAQAQRSVRIWPEGRGARLGQDRHRWHATIGADRFIRR